VTGGKGGVGKSTVAANLGLLVTRELEALGRPERALLVDLDFGLANLHVLLDARPSASLEDFFAGRVPLEACLAATPSGARLLTGGSGSPELGRPDGERRAHLLRALAALPPEHGLLLGDSAAGIGPDVLDFAALAERVILVTTPDPAALVDAYGVLKALDAHARAHDLEVPTPEVFVNMARDAGQAAEIAERLRSTSQTFLSRSPRLAGWMPDARLVRESVARQEPFVARAPDSLAARCLRPLARRCRDLLAAGTAVSGLKASAGHAR
jgi:flagellar biosynthesis protein FlhG